MRTQVFPAVILVLVSTAPLSAKEILLPNGKPQVSLQLPDDWTVHVDDAGLQAVSPETNSFVYAKIMRRPKDDPNLWLKGTLAKLQDRGVAFVTAGSVAKGAKPMAPQTATAVPPAPVSGTKSIIGTPTVSDPNGAQHPPEAAVSGPAAMAALRPVGEAAPARNTKAEPAAGTPPADVASALPALVSPSGADAMSSPPQVPAVNALASPPAMARSVPTFTMGATVAAKPGNRFPRHALPYKDTSLHGTPVDVELMTYTLPDRSVFFLLQESGQSDDRVVDIINSVKPAP